MKIIFSNHYQALEAALLDDLEALPGDDPLVPVQVVIPSLALRRRLELASASRFGVCANLHCGYLAQWLWEQIGRFVSVPRLSPFAPNLLVWRLYRLLSGPSLPGAERLSAYLSKADELMRFELAQRLSTLFDHYLTYRPEWLAAWSEGRLADIGSSQAVHQQDAAWQAQLWRLIVDELGLKPFHPAADFFAQAATVAPHDPRLETLPKTVFVYCLPSMPPLYIRLLEALARWVEVRIYALNPCRQYWFEIVDRKRLSSLSLAGREAHHEVGNQLLASWGRQTRAHIDLLLGETAAEVMVDDSRFQINTPRTMLAALQNAILDLEPLPPFTPERDDRSIEIHACHHLTRQLEVLHDQLLALFNGPDPPRPDEVLVVTPNLGQAAPLIDAVFGTSPLSRRLPYVITGRPATQENIIARIVLQLLALPQSRFAASEIFQLLQEAPIARRFNLEADDQHHIQGWLKKSGVRWGLDADHRRDCGMMPSSRHTFAEGLQRLFLGYALPDGEDQLVAGVLACSVGEGAKARTLGRFWLFVEALDSLRRDLNAARPPDEWRLTILALIETFFEPEEELLVQLKEVRAALADLCAEMAALGTEGVTSLAVFRAALSARMDDPARGGVPSGRLTFAAMSSLRGLPYRVICLLAMDDGAYPGTVSPIEFDLMTVQPRRGDLQRRHDERNVFLDLLLAARERLIITYSGRSVRDNAPLPPSVLVDELLDQLLPAIANGENDANSLRAARQRLVVEHPLQPFSPRYFRLGGDPRLFSFDAEYAEAARLASTMTRSVGAALPGTGEMEGDGDDQGLQPAFLHRPLSLPDETWRTVSLEQLLRFFRNPCRYFLTERLGVELVEAEAELADDEPFTLDWEGWRSASDRLLPLMLAGADRERIAALAAAGHEFPNGRPGELLRGRELTRLGEFATVVRAALTELRPQALPFRFDFVLNGESWTLSGALTGITPQGLIRYRGDDTRPADYLTLWLSHLALCALRPQGVPPASRGLSLNGVFAYQAVDKAQEILKQLLGCYREGLCRPLPFFLKSAWAYAAPGGTLQKARSRWQSSLQRPHGEDRDPYCRLALRGVADPLAGDFQGLARTVFGPLLLHLEDARLS